MNRKNTQTYQMLTHVVDFGTRNVGLFPQSSGATKLLETLGTGAETLSEQAGIWVASQTAVRNGLTAKEASRENLKSYLSRAAQLSRALHADKVQLPVRLTDQSLIDSGKGFLIEAGSMKQEFVEHGLSANFAEDFAAAVRDFEKTIQDYRDAKGRRSASLKKWNETLEDTLDVLGRFDVLVSNALANDHAALASYAIARTIRKVRGRKATGNPSATDPAPVRTAAAAAA